MLNTRRSPTAAAIASASCAASTTITSRSSPISQTLLSTSQVPPSRLKVPEVTRREIMLASAFRCYGSAARGLSEHKTVSHSRGAAKHHHTPQHLAALHSLEGGLDIIQADRLGDELLQR